MERGAHSTAMTLGEALRRASRDWPERPALLHESGTWTWRALDEQVDLFAAQLCAAGVGARDAVGFLLNKRPELVIGFLAVARLGAIVVPVNFRLPAETLKALFEVASVRAVVVEEAHAAVLDGLGPQRPARVLDIGALPDLPATQRNLSFEEPDPDSPCYYNYTSGTTGVPKGAITTHRNILANATATVRALGFREDDIFLGMFSVFSHPHELFHRALVVGAPFVLSDSFSPRVVMEAIARHRVRWMMAVPSFYEMMLDYVDQRVGEGVPDLSSLRVLEAGGAYVGAETVSRMEERFSGAALLPVWGATEVTGVAIANGPVHRRDDATGLPLAGYEVRVVDPAGAPLPAGEVGELWVRGEAVVSGYVRNAEETGALFHEGWYATGDLVSQDADGFVHFAGRRSEMLKVGGLRVYPLEIEVVLRRHPEVRDAVVVGVADRLRGELARAVLCTLPGSTLDARGVRSWCRANLARYKLPRVIEFWEELPRLPNGKVDKRAVAAVAPDPDRDLRPRPGSA